MAYILGGLTLPTPRVVLKDTIEVAQQNETLFGTTTKKTLHRKFKYSLEYNYLELDVVNSILSLFEQDEVMSFESTETNFPVTAIDVLVDIGQRTYPAVGKTYVENFKLVLTEVKGD